MKSLRALRDWLHTIAERSYPFPEVDSDGQKVYLRQAYHVRYGLCQEALGRMPNMHCWKIFLWREFLHLWLGIFFWALALGIHYLVGSPYSWILPGVLLLYFIVQEVYIDRVRYDQPWLRSAIDLIVWGLPLVLFFIVHIF